MIWLASILSMLLGAFACFVVMSVSRGPDPDEDDGEVEADDVLDVPRCPTLDYVNFRTIVGDKAHDGHRHVRCELESGHVGPHFAMAGDNENWWSTDPPADPTVVYVCWEKDSGELASATARPAQAQGLARLGHDVRVVPFQKAKLRKVEVE